MNIGDIVMFIGDGTYAKWFFGQLGAVESYTPTGADGKSHCRVRWMQPVKYHNRLATISDFSTDKFEVVSEDR